MLVFDRFFSHDELIWLKKGAFLATLLSVMNTNEEFLPSPDPKSFVPERYGRRSALDPSLSPPHAKFTVSLITSFRETAATVVEDRHEIPIVSFFHRRDLQLAVLFFLTVLHAFCHADQHLRSGSPLVCWGEVCVSHDEDSCRKVYTAVGNASSGVEMHINLLNEQDNKRGRFGRIIRQGVWRREADCVFRGIWNLDRALISRESLFQKRRVA